MGQSRSLEAKDSGTEALVSERRETRRSEVRPSVHAAPPIFPPRFRVVGLLGQGGMGSVYEAFDHSLGHNVALKCLFDLGPADQQRLKGEFRTLSNVVHPNLVSLYELFVDDASCFFTMERVVGQDFVKDVRRAAAEDAGVAIEHVRNRSRQLALAIAALHRAEAIHRDVKPSNVLVTASGRVVLLDFGLATPLSNLALVNAMTGTLEYMAPEQHWGLPLTPATDWYAFGVTLYEALTGVLPFTGAPFDIATRKRAGKVAPVSSLARVPSDVEELVMSLLRPEPAARPSAAEVLRCLGGVTDGALMSTDRPLASAHPPRLVNRKRELGLLEQALDDVRNGSQRVVHVHGPSGIGKTELVKWFTRAPGATNRLVLLGRCHPQESVQFNALDGAIDDLCVALLRMTPEELTEILPNDPEALVRLFPVLGSVQALSVPSGQSGGTGAQNRRRAFEALRDLLSRLGKRYEVIVVLDDLQWGDLDSGLLLRELLRGPAAPPLLVLLTYRTEDRGTSACLLSLEEDRDASLSETRSIELGPLDSAESIELLRAMAGATVEIEGRFEQLTREAGGSPFFLGEIGRYLSDRDATRTLPEGLGLREMLLARADRLGTAEHRLLELVAVAGGPLDRGVLLHAARLPAAERTTLALLERLALLRTSGTSTRGVEIYHHRIRDELLTALPDAMKREHHLALADAMVAYGDANAYKLVEHYVAAGELDGARRYVVAAAGQAATALAFDRAAQLYEQAIELGGTELDPSELYARLGQALANGERARDAGRAFGHAYRLLGESGAVDPQRLFYLQRSAAEQFLKSGHDREGVEAFGATLERLEIDYPKTRNEALRKALLMRLSGLFRPLGAVSKTAEPASHHARDRAEMLYTIATTLGIVDHTRSNYASAQCFLAACEAGAPDILIRAAAAEAACWGAIPLGLARRRARSLTRFADDLVAEHGAGDVERGSLSVAKASLAWLDGDWAESVRHADQACAAFQSHGRGVSFDIAMAKNWGLAALALTGNVRDLVAQVLALVDDAEQRDDRFLARISSLGQPSLTWLALDRPAYARERADRAIAWWASDNYRLQHYQHYIATAQALLYEGRGHEAHRTTLEHWPKLQANHYLVVPCARDELAHLRARTALAAAADLSAGVERRALLELAGSCLRPLSRHGLGCGAAWAALVNAGLLSLKGRERAARRSLEGAIVACDRAGMALFREAARYALGKLSGSKGEADVARAEEWFEAQDVENPRAMVRMLVPGCLEAYDAP